MRMTEITEILEEQASLMQAVKEARDNCSHLSQLLVIPLWKEEQGDESGSFLSKFEDLHLFFWTDNKIAPWHLSVMFGRLSWVLFQMFKGVCTKVDQLKHQLQGTDDNDDKLP